MTASRSFDVPLGAAYQAPADADVNATSELDITRVATIAAPAYLGALRLFAYCDRLDHGPVLLRVAVHDGVGIAALYLAYVGAPNVAGAPLELALPPAKGPVLGISVGRVKTPAAADQGERVPVALTLVVQS